MAKKVTKIPVDGESKGQSVKVKRSVKMAEAVDTLMELDDKTYRHVIRVARSYRRINNLTNRLFKRESVSVEVDGFEQAAIVNNLTSLGGREFRKVVKCTKQYRKASHILDNAIAGYSKLRKEDEAESMKNLEAAYA